MKRRLFLFLFIAALLLVLGAIATACGDDDGGENDEGIASRSYLKLAEDSIRNTIQEANRACNEGEFARQAEFVAAGGPGCPAGAPNDVEVLSVTIDGDEATAETIRTDNEGETHEETVVFRKDGRWLIQSVS